MTTVPKKPVLSAVKRVDYDDCRLFFESKYKVDHKSFLEFLLQHNSDRVNHTVMSVEFALINGDEKVANFAGCLQKEFKEPVLVFDMTKYWRLNREKKE